MRDSGWSVAGIAAAAVLACACGDRKSAARDDLGEAGYRPTTADFLRAAGADDTAALARFLDGGTELMVREEGGDTALHEAATAGAEKAAGFLLGHGIDVNVTGAGGRTPLAAAVAGNQIGMIRYLLRQGADPDIKDGEGFKPLMWAVKAGQVRVVEELAPYVRDDFDTALLMAALLGRPEMIDTLTNYGASVYARTDDGRTALMVASEHGHLGAVNMLLEIGANRYAVDEQGRTAAELAAAAGHTEVVAALDEASRSGEFGLEPPEVAAEELLALANVTTTDRGAAADGAGDARVLAPVRAGGGEAAEQGAGGERGGTAPPALTGGAAVRVIPWQRPDPVAGGNLAAPVSEAPPVDGTGDGRVARAPLAANSAEPESARPGPPPSLDGAVVSHAPSEAADGTPAPAIVMRHYRESVLPVSVVSVEDGHARLRMLAGERREVEVAEGAPVPGSRLQVVRIERRLSRSKLNNGRLEDVSLVEVEDLDTGRRRQWITGMAASAHDPFALVEDRGNGRRYLARPGARFRTDAGAEYAVVDVRPDQLVLEHVATGETLTLPLRGPCG